MIPQRSRVAQYATFRSCTKSSRTEAAWPAPIPQDANTPPLPTFSGPWRARWHLARLAHAVRRDGWTTRLRTETPRTLLRVYAKAAPTIGESISVAWGDGAWWYQSSTGLWLTPCKRVDLAAEKLNILLTPWVSAAFDALRDEHL